MALTDYSNMEKEIAETPDPTVLKKGSEVKARIISVRSGISDTNNAQWYSPVFDVPDEPLAKEFNDFFWDLADRDKLDVKVETRNRAKFKNFASAFGLDYSKPFDWEEDLIGLEGWLIVGIRKTNDFGDQNTVQKYLAKGGAGKSSSVEEAPF